MATRPVGRDFSCSTLAVTGHADADCIEQLAKDELGNYLGALSPPSMRAVNQALAIALGLV